MATFEVEGGGANDPGGSEGADGNDSSSIVANGGLENGGTAPVPPPPMPLSQLAPAAPVAATKDAEAKDAAKTRMEKYKADSKAKRDATREAKAAAATDASFAVATTEKDDVESAETHWSSSSDEEGDRLWAGDDGDVPLPSHKAPDQSAAARISSAHGPGDRAEFRSGPSRGG